MRFAFSLITLNQTILCEVSKYNTFFFYHFYYIHHYIQLLPVIIFRAAACFLRSLSPVVIFTNIATAVLLSGQGRGFEGGGAHWAAGCVKRLTSAQVCRLIKQFLCVIHKDRN